MDKAQLSHPFVIVKRGDPDGPICVSAGARNIKTATSPLHLSSIFLSLTRHYSLYSKLLSPTLLIYYFYYSLAIMSLKAGDSFPQDVVFSYVNSFFPSSSFPPLPLPQYTYF